MKEPKLKDFIADLNVENLSLAELMVDQEKLSQMLWYMDKSKADTVADAIRRDYNEEVQDRVMTNLMKLYPLSQYIVLRVVQSLPKTTDAIAKGIDEGEKIVKVMYGLVKEISSKSRNFTHAFDEKQREITTLDANISKYKANAAKLTKQNQEISKKKKELEEAKKEASVEAKEERARALQVEINSLKKKRDELEESIKAYEDEKSNLGKRIREIEGKVENRGAEGRALKALLKHFPQDREDEEK